MEKYTSKIQYNNTVQPTLFENLFELGKDIFTFDKVEIWYKKLFVLKKRTILKFKRLQNLYEKEESRYNELYNKSCKDKMKIREQLTRFTGVLLSNLRGIGIKTEESLPINIENPYDERDIIKTIIIFLKYFDRFLNHQILLKQICQLKYAKKRVKAFKEIILKLEIALKSLKVKKGELKNFDSSIHKTDFMSHLRSYTINVTLSQRDICYNDGLIELELFYHKIMWNFFCKVEEGVESMLNSLF